MGCILHPNTNKTVDCYVDADFAGAWTTEMTLDPNSIRSMVAKTSD
jgi:hypothetical protein